MPRLLPIVLGPDIDQVFVLDGEPFRFTFRWKKRSRLWYVTIKTTDDEIVVSSRALQAGTLPLRGHRFERPPGILLVDGPPEYEFDDLGDRLRLVYFSSDEISSLAPSDGLAVI